MDVDKNQRDWSAFFANEERQRAARKKLIENLPDFQASRRVKDVLFALAELAEVDPKTERFPDGSVQLSVPLGTIQWKLGVKSRNTVRSALDEAILTGFLEITGSLHRSHTYSIRWLAIVNQSNSTRGETIPEGVSGQRSAGWGRRGQTRGSKLAAEGVNSQSLRGSIDPGQGGQFDPVNLTPSSSGFRNPGVCNDINKNPGFNPEGGQRFGGQIPHVTSGKPFWWAWRHAIANRNLANPVHVQELYELAVEAGCFPASQLNRFEVFAQAAHDRRVSQKPGAFFRENVAIGRWYASLEDTDRAEAMLRELDKKASVHPEMRPLPDEFAEERQRKLSVRAVQPVEPDQENEREFVEVGVDEITAKTRDHFRDQLAEVQAKIRARRGG